MRLGLTLLQVFVLCVPALVSSTGARATDRISAPVHFPHQPYIKKWVESAGISLPRGAAMPQSILTIGGADFSKAKEIIVITLNPNIGDNVVSAYTQLEYLHEKNPKAVIKVLSPTSRVLNQSAWLKPIQIPVDLPMYPGFERGLLGKQKGAAASLKARVSENPSYLSERLRAAISPNLSPDAFYVYEEHSVSYLAEQIVNDVGIAPKEKHLGMMIREDFDDLGDWLNAEIMRLQSGAVFATEDDYVVIPGKGRKSSGPLSREIEFRAFRQWDPKTVYEAAALRARFLFGPDAYVSWPIELYHDFSAHRDRLQTLLKASFQDSTRPFVVLNMNTRNRYKIAASKDYYIPVYQSLVENLKKKYPDVNVFLAPVEPAFGRTTERAVAKMIAQNPGKIALLPVDDKAVWNSVVSEAAVVISQDSGFVHLSNVFNDRVLSLAFPNKNISAEGWVRPGQTMTRVDFASFTKGERKEYARGEPAVLNWLDENLSAALAGSSGGCLQRFLKNR